MHVNDSKKCTCSSGAACIGDWGTAKLCKCLKMPLYHIPSCVDLVPHNIEINKIYNNNKKTHTLT